MRAEVRFTIPEAEPGELAGAAVVVVDVLRATSTLLTALARGAKAIYPSSSTEDAIRLAQSLGREDTLLCGERKGLRIEGFDLGNSPLEFSEEAVAGKRLVMSTTNGTRAFLAAKGADMVVALSFLNLSAVSAALRDRDRVLILCAGREDAFALEDAVCAGMLLRSLLDRGVQLDPGDGARAVLALAGDFTPDEAFLSSTEAGHALRDAGMGEDLAWCARLDAFDLVAVLKEQALVPLAASEA